MPWQGKVAFGLQATAAALALALPASASAGERADYAVGFAERAPGAPTAMTLHIRYKHPDDPEAKPSPVRRVVIELPAGTELRDGTRCDADDGALRAQGRAACPPESQVGTGAITVMTGLEPFDPFPTDVTLFRGQGELIELLSRQGADETIAIERLKFEGTRMSANVQRFPGGPPDGEVAARTVDWTVPAGWLVTPATCPPEGVWTARGEFTFADGATAVETATTPCDPAAAPAAAPVRAAWVSVSPARARAGRRTRFRVRLRASDRCRGGALVRLGGRRARTDATGAATVVARLRKGRHRVLAGRHRCPRRSAVVVVG